MPELPEMEHYRSLLDRLLHGRRILEAEVGREKSLNVPAETFTRRVVGRRVAGVGRRAKQLIFRLDDGANLLLHLMLGGWMFYGTEEERPDRTVQVRLGFDDGRSLYFIGLRLGHLHVLDDPELAERLAELGPEPFDPALTEAGFAKRFAGRSGAIKPLLTDQRLIAGIGNCYSDEICFAAGILPLRRAGDLRAEDWNGLYRAMRTVLREATEGGGYMEHPLMRGDALTGAFDDRVRVYDRQGEPCPRCGEAIVQSEVSGRKTFYCPRCQR